MIEIAARENGVRCIEVGHWTVGGCACDTLQLLLFLAHAQKKKEGSVLLKIWLVCASAAIVTAYGRAPR